MEDFTLLLGRFHPTFLHLPIGFLLIAFCMEFFARFKRYEYLRFSVNFVLFFASIFAVIAALMGYFLAEEGGYNEQLLFVHKWLGIGTAVMSILLFLLRLGIKNNLKLLLSKAYLTLWIMLMLTLTLAGHYGGSLTHGENYLTEFLPKPIKQLAGFSMQTTQKKRVKLENINEALVFEDVIMPILEKKCVSCHNPDKKKGNLMMATAEGFLKGGEHGEIFKAGNLKESGIYIAVTLPRNDEYAMPPEGKEPMTEEEVKLLGWWISEGADFKKKVSELQISPEIAQILGVSGASTNANTTATIPDVLPTLQAKPAENAIIESLIKQKIEVNAIASNSPFLQVKINQDLTDQKLDALQKIAEQITWLDLKRSNISDKQLVKLKNFKNLTELRLELTAISDEGLKHLEGLTNLQYLNLYGTKISGAGLKSLEKMPHLRNVYLWQTSVSQEDTKELQQAKPQLKIDLGLDKVALDSLGSKL